MLNKNTKIKVKNRSTGTVGYSIPDMNNLTRKFYAGELKEVTFEELQKLSYKPGGMYILENYLIIVDNDEALKAILGQVELEYNYTESEIKYMLENGSIDELLDCLDFAPAGVIELVKKIAVEIEINDLKKRKAIFEKTGFNINEAIRIKNESEETTSDEDAAKEAAPARRVVIKK